MAEILGVVASAAGVVGLAAQAVEGIRKLQQFCKDIHDAPEELLYILEELELLTNEINSIEAQIYRNTYCSNYVDPSAALRSCRRSVEITNTIIKELHNEIQKRRKSGSLRAAWKKNKIETWMIRIERAKTTLALAVSTYTREMNTQNFMIIERKVDNLSSASVIPTNFGVAQLQSPTSAMATVTFSSSSTATSQDSLVHHSKSLRQDDRDDSSVENSLIPRTRYRKGTKPRSVAKLGLRLPSWLLSRSWEIDISFAANGWTVKLREYRTVPNYCDLFNAILDCDIPEIQHLLESGKASVFDRNEDSWSVLHVLASAASQPSAGTKPFTQLAHLFIDCGAGINTCNKEMAYPFQIYSPQFHSFCLAKDTHLVATSASINLLRLFVGDGDLDFDWRRLPLTFELSTTCDVEVAQFSYNQFNSGNLAGVSKLSLDGILEECMSTEPFACPATLACWLGVDDLSIIWFESKDTIRKDLLIIMLRGYGFITAFEDTERIDSWRKTFMKLVNLGFDHLSLATSMDSLLGAFEDFFQGFDYAKYLSRMTPMKGLRQQGISKFAEIGLKCFIFRLESIGTDLSALGSIVVAGWQSDRGEELPTLDLNWEETDGWGYVTVYGFTNGPKADDWSILISHPLDEWAGEFWDMIEHPERIMPGTWDFYDG